MSACTDTGPIVSPNFAEGLRILETRTSSDTVADLNFVSWSWVWFHFESRRSTFRPNVLKQLPLFNLVAELPHGSISHLTFHAIALHYDLL